MRYMLWAFLLCTHLCAWGDELTGGKERLRHENIVADKAGFVRIWDETELRYLVEIGYLAPLEESAGFVFDVRAPEKFRFVLPCTREYLRELSRAFYQEFRTNFWINSVTRTIEYQEALILINSNAAAAFGPLASSHLTGATVDIGKLKLSGSQVLWLRHRLIRDERSGRIQATEEHIQAVFHIMVYPRWMQKEKKKR